MNLQKLIGYLSTTLGGAVGALVGQRVNPELGAEAGAAAGALVSFVGAVLLHRLQPPKPPEAK